MEPPKPCAASSITNNPSASAIARMAAWSAGNPNRSTGMIAFGFRPAALAALMAPAIVFGFMLKVSASTSTKTGVAPTSTATSAVAQKVKDGQITASPGPMPRARNGSTSASVPLAQVTACLAPEKAASSASNARTSGPRMNWQWSSTRVTAVSMAAPNRRRCAATSMKGMGGSSTRGFMIFVIVFFYSTGFRPPQSAGAAAGRHPPPRGIRGIASQSRGWPRPPRRSPPARRLCAPRG